MVSILFLPNCKKLKYSLQNFNKGNDEQKM